MKHTLLTTRRPTRLQRSYANHFAILKVGPGVTFALREYSGPW